MYKQPKQATHVRAKMRWGIAAIFALLFIAVAFDAPQAFNKGVDGINNVVHLGIPHVPVKPFRLGLDLRGGAQLVYQADLKDIPFADQGQAVNGVRDVIERRVNSIGVSEPQVQTTKSGENYRLLVELPGVHDVNDAINLIGETPILEFREQNTEPPRQLTQEEQKQLDAYNADAKKRAQDALKALRSGKSFEDVVKQYSEDETGRNNGGYLGFINIENADEVVYDWAKSHRQGETSGVLEAGNGFVIAQRGREQDGPVQVTASHIVVCYLGARNCDNATLTKDQARAKADELFAQANADNFAQLAIDNSTDLISGPNGGDLGTFGKGDVFTKEFEDAVFSAKVGEIIGPVETELGFHIIYKRGEEPTKEYEVSRILVRTQSPEDILPQFDPWKVTGLSGKQLDRAEVVTDQQTGAVQVSLQFDAEGTKLFEDITRRNLSKPVAIFLDGDAISVPTVQSIISGGQAVITGSFTIPEARLLAQRLNTGALPVPIELVSQQTIGPSLGAASLAKSLRAGTIGLLLVMVFLTLYYRLPGLLASLALGLYIALTLAIFKLIGATLTLSGITGLILSIGMAVDANILIFERLKEELRIGKSLKTAVNEGFARAWTSIYDGNVATIITAALLLAMGVSFVKGFAFTLIIGTLLSMFTAVTVTRVLLQMVVSWFGDKKSFLFLGSKE